MIKTINSTGYIIKLLTTALLFTLTGCGTSTMDHALHYHNNDNYLTSVSLPPLQLPPQYAGAPLDSQYIIPAMEHRQQKVTLVPPGSLLAQKHASTTPTSPTTATEAH
ncbi:MAG: hypothetical protein ACX932_01955 [Gammaproteobacteria bacterium]